MMGLKAFRKFGQAITLLPTSYLNVNNENAEEIGNGDENDGILDPFSAEAAITDSISKRQRHQDIDTESSLEAIQMFQVHYV